jgi:hypothetical protein
MHNSARCPPQGERIFLSSRFILLHGAHHNYRKKEGWEKIRKEPIGIGRYRN